MRPRGAPGQLQQRRLRAVRLLQAGRPLAAVARQVQASVSSVWRWRQTYAGPRLPTRSSPVSSDVVDGSQTHETRERRDGSMQSAEKDERPGPRPRGTNEYAGSVRIDHPSVNTH
jgi:hypothetical protein